MHIEQKLHLKKLFAIIQKEGNPQISTKYSYLILWCIYNVTKCI